MRGGRAGGVPPFAHRGAARRGIRRHGRASAAGLVAARAKRLAKSLLEPRIVADGREVVVRPRLVAERREPLDAAPETLERLAVDFAGERREARVVVVQACVVREL